MDGHDDISNAWAALKPVRKAIEQPCPCRRAAERRAVLLLYRPEPIHEGEALAKAIIETVESNDGPVDVADDSDAECFARAGIVPVTRLAKRTPSCSSPLMANSMLILLARSASMPDKVRLRMSCAVPSSAATHSAARRSRGRFRLLDIVDVGCVHSGFARGCSTQRGPALRALT